jgi:hypothetical protein
LRSRFQGIPRRDTERKQVYSRINGLMAVANNLQDIRLAALELNDKLLAYLIERALYQAYETLAAKEAIIETSWVAHASQSKFDRALPGSNSAPALR